jgi:hypothetical protein
MAHDPAMARYFTMTATRIGASLLMVLGIILLAGNARWADRLIGQTGSQVVGFACVIAGMLVLLLVLPRLARRWRSEPPSP